MISTVEKVLFLKGVDLFKSIPGEDLTHIAAIAEQVDFPAGYSFFQRVSPVRRCFSFSQVPSIFEAEIPWSPALDQNSASVKWRSSMPNQGPPPSERQASSAPSRFFHDDFTEMLAEKPEIARGIIKVLTRRLREANRRN